MEQIGIISSSNGDTFNERLLKFSERYQIKNQQNRERVAKFRQKEEDVTHYESVTLSPKVKLSKVKVYKDIIGNFVPPTFDEVAEFCKARQNKVDAEHFINHYQARGWILNNGRKVKDWKSCVITWEKNDKNRTKVAGETDLETEARAMVEQYKAVEDLALFKFKAKYPNEDILKYKHIFNW